MTALIPKSVVDARLTRAFHSSTMPSKSILHENMDVVYAGDPRIMTALSWGAKSGYVECVKALLHAGAAPNLQDQIGRTPLMVCREVECVKALLHGGAAPNLQDNGGRTVLTMGPLPADCVKALLATGEFSRNDITDALHRVVKFCMNGHCYRGGFTGLKKGANVEPYHLAVLVKRRR